MSSSDDEDDGDYVPEALEDEDLDATEAADDAADKKRGASVAADPHVDALWDDINASTAVSKKAADRTAKLLSGLTRRTSSKKSKQNSKKRKLREFQIPVLSVDVKRSRRDLETLAAASHQTVERVVKFAGKEYSVSTRAVGEMEAKPTRGRAKGLDKVLASLDEPKKVSTMEKTSLDWDKFKQVEGIEDELAQSTKGGYIEKQEFLQRLDVKRFEIEKAERDRQRRLQQQK